MTNYPNSLDNDVTLPSVIDNITENGADAINALKYAVLAMQQELGIKPAGVLSSLVERLNVSFNSDGTLKSSTLNSLGVATLPIYNNEVAASAGILESKLDLDYPTAQLQNDITLVKSQADNSTSWIFTTGSKLQPHISGSNYYHTLSHILVSNLTSDYFKNKFGVNRNNTNSFEVLKDLNADFVDHQQSDGTGTSSAVLTKSGTSFPSSYAHFAGGIFMDTTRFGYIPQTNKSLQSVVEFLDNSSVFLYGTRVQNLYSNGISRISRSADITRDGYGSSIVSDVRATTFLRNTGAASYPVDDIEFGDDIIQLTPSGAILTSHQFDHQFSLIKPGDIIKVNYGGIELDFLIKEKKYLQSGGNKTFIVRIHGKNLKYTTSASVTISKPLVNDNKFGALSVSSVENDFSFKPSLIAASPRSAMVCGIGFNSNLITNTNYNLYLAFYPTGNPSDGYVTLPAIDVTGDLGVSAGKYTLDSIVSSTNESFRQNGYNLRFQAYSYKGEFGITMTDPIGNSSFSIISGIIDSNGFYDQIASEFTYPNNVIGLFNSGSILAKDGLGFGPSKGNFASPLPLTTYGSPEQAYLPTKIFAPLTRNNFYVNAIELDRLSKDVDQLNDEYGDGYWRAELIGRNVIPGVRVGVTYRVYQDLSTSKLEPGKTITVQSAGFGTIIDFGRFIISNVDYTNCNTLGYSDITLYDAIHANGSSPAVSLGSTGFGSGNEKYVRLYFGDDSIGFNSENSADNSVVGPFKRFFEVYVDQFGKTFTHEKARMYLGAGSLSVNGSSLAGNAYASFGDITYVSPKFKGFTSGQIKKIKLNVSLNTTTGVVQGYLSLNAYPDLSHNGPTSIGRIGEKIRFYDESNLDYIEIIFKNDQVYSTFSLQNIDIQIFSSLANDQDIMQIATCQLNDSTNKVEHLTDQREFGNTSEKDLTTSALDYIGSTGKHTNINGVLKGFELQSSASNPYQGQILFKGGSALVNGKIVQKDTDFVSIPLVKEVGLIVPLDIKWAICINDKADFVVYPLLEGASGTERVMHVINLLTSQNYDLTAYLFKDLVDRKDLCVLYTVLSNITIPSNSQSLVIKDARRFAYNSDTSGFAKYGDKEFGNYRSAASLLEWMALKPELTTAQLGGCTYETITSDVTIGGHATLKEVDGQNNSFIRMVAPAFYSSPNLHIKNNIILKNVSLSLEEATVVCADALTNVTFENCTITVGTPSTSKYGLYDTIFNLTNANNIRFINNTFDIYFIDSGSGSDNGAAFKFTNCSNVLFKGNTVNVTYNTSDTGNVFEGVSSSVKFEDNIITTNSKCAVKHVNTNIDMFNNTLNVSYNPFIAGDGYYSQSNFINHKIGYVKGYCSVPVDYVRVNNNKFVYTNTSGSYLDRNSYFVYELGAAGSSVNNFEANDNTFINTNALSSNTVSEFDVRGLIAVVNSYFTSVLNEGNLNTDKPTIKHLSISNNYSDQYGTILVSSASKLTDNNVEYIPNPGLSVSGEISNNKCGNIGYWVASKNINNSKKSQLKIFGNICKMIASMNHKGYIYKPMALKSNGTIETLMVNHYTGQVSIEDNTTSWIVGGQALGNSFNIISGNELFAYNNSYRVKFNNTDGYYHIGSLTGDNVAIYNIGTTDLTDSKNINCVIKDNKLNKGEIVDALGAVTSTYVYEYSGICTNVSCDIYGNTIDFVNNQDFNGTMDARIVVSALNFNIHHNTILNTRPNGSSTNYYMLITGYANKYVTNPYGFIVDNIFENPKYNNATDDGAFSSTIVGRINVNFFDYEDIDRVFDQVTAERNKNQSKQKLIQLSGNSYGDNNGSEKYGVSINGSPNKVTVETGSYKDIVNSFGDTYFGYYASKISLEEALPTNVKPTSISGSLLKGAGNVNDIIYVNYRVEQVINTIDSPQTLSTFLTDVTPPTFTPLTESVTLSLSNPDTGVLLNQTQSLLAYNFRTNKNKELRLTLSGGFVQNGANGITLEVSAAVLIYRW
jgi:hypothetical protein